MRVSQLLTKTLRQAPAEADTISHQLLVRAGMVHQVVSGVYSYLPLGWRVLRNLEQIIRNELDKAGGQELMMPVLQPFELWERTGRHRSFGQSLFSLTDRRGRKLCLGPTHEEIVTELVRHQVRSYRDLPLLLYQIQTKFRDEPRPRGGLLRVREFPMMDLYSFDTDEAGLDISYQKIRQAYINIFDRCSLPTMEVEADSGAIGGKDSHEFMVITESGEDMIIHCHYCKYAANMEKAQSIKAGGEHEPLQPVEEIATPNKKSIEEVADFLRVPRSSTLKAVLYLADGNLVFVIIRGDLEVNETKLKNALKCSDLQLASEDRMRQAGLVAGSASPIGLSDIKTVADDSIKLGTNFVAGANKPDYHLRHVNYPRDFQVDMMLDIAVAQSGQGCPKCGKALASTRGIEAGHIFKLGTVFSEELGAFFLDQKGETKPIIMGCYGIGVGRLMAAAIEQNHDGKGIVWPVPLAPYLVYLCALGTDNADVVIATEKLYADLKGKGFEVLFDDRQESPGVKFNDADLLGIPIRLVVSPRTLKSQSAELKWRHKEQSELLPLEGIGGRIQTLLVA
ncbi:MAG: proline--tRNA ligase [Chloroflexi bacterium RBG_13_53_26]|nr:MAG: proline--tRNA ligase [Chloroflexi bacterium RBG_13_53_26]